MFNPATAAKNIKSEFVDYVATSHHFSNPDLRRQFRAELERSIACGPYVELHDIFKTGCTINQLVEEGVLSPLFRKLEDHSGGCQPKLPLDRPLYLHQERAVRSIVAGRNLVVTTGTGSGKTNCFLIPVLNELLREQEKGTLGAGVRALFIYPMNALANDQIKNIRHLLMHYPSITFGVYNGATEYCDADAEKAYKSMFYNEKQPELREKLPNEILSRDAMKKTPPNLLFTNYAMLEHLLFRPKDDVLFSNADFRFVVLDEAHIYTGATGIETAILLRRLRARINSSDKVQFVLTSATLGGDSKSDDDDIVKFASNLSGVHFESSDIIRSTREEYSPRTGCRDYPQSAFKELADGRNLIGDVLRKYDALQCSDSEVPDEERLYDFLINSSLYNAMREAMRSSGLWELGELADNLRIGQDTAIAFIALCSHAQKNGKALLDARYHFFIRSLEGCYLAWDTKKNEPSKLFLTRKSSYSEAPGQEQAVFEVGLCDDCGKVAFAGKIENGKLVQVGNLEEDLDYFYPEADDNQLIENDEEEISKPAKRKKEVFYFCPRCGAIANQELKMKCDCSDQSWIKVVKAGQTDKGAHCGSCARGIYKRFYLGNDAATSVLATALYEELPEIEYVNPDESRVSKQNDGNIFGAVLRGTPEARKKVRQFLVFSDSRQEAAKFACYLGKAYEEFLRRRGIVHVIDRFKSEIKRDCWNISDLVRKLSKYFGNKGIFEDCPKEAWVAVLNELFRFNSPTSLVALGWIQFEYIGNTDEIVDAVSHKYPNVTKDDIRNLLNYLVFEIVKAYAVCTDDRETDIGEDERDYLSYSKSQKFVTGMGSGSPNIMNWFPKNKPEKPGEYYRTNRMYWVRRILNVDEKEAYRFLHDYFSLLTDKNFRWHMDDPGLDGKNYVMPAKNFRVLVSGDANARWYKCRRCGKITQFNMGGVCPSVGCGGRLEEVGPASIAKDNHYAKLYESEQMSPLRIKEHTAQLDKRKSLEYQESFIKKDINALSCSTTFEMGVDVGDLETVFLRNIPPLPSNYAQRAGRAGRSINAAAFVLTFAKLSSHDLSFFTRPKDMISGRIQPPLFKLDNEKIARRHIYAVALGMFFSAHEEMYNKNDADVFLNHKGYEKFLQWLDSNPDDLRDLLRRSIPDIGGLHDRLGIEDYSWLEEFCGPRGIFTLLIRDYENNIAEFNRLIRAEKKENIESLSKLYRQQELYKKNRLIDFFARGNILPRYGFPVDTVELKQNRFAQGGTEGLQLSRDLQIAIGEYAPSSEIVADGHMYTSRYIKKSLTDSNRLAWHTAFIGECKDCKGICYSLSKPEHAVCPACGKAISTSRFEESIEPRAGFMADENVKSVPMKKQERNYRTEDVYIGNKEAKTIQKQDFYFNGKKLTVESTTNDSLLVRSQGCFYVCNKCGYGISEDDVENLCDEKRSGSPKVHLKKAHKNSWGQKCDSNELHKYRLHHVFNTDVAKISFENCDTSSYEMMLSVMYALLNAISRELNIERRDIKACLKWSVDNGQRHHSIIIYDSVPGGAGHARRLVTKEGGLYRIFMSALKAMEDCDCDPSCYKCLRSYENQRVHDKLDRKLAIEFLQRFKESERC